MEKNTLTTYDVAQYCQVTPRTVIQWVNEGKLNAFRTPGNHSRITVEEFLSFLKKYNMPIPTEFTSPRANYKKRILIVDDDEGMVESLLRLLKRENIYELEVAYDGFEAGEKFTKFKPDLMITDVRMPGLDGYKLCSHIRSKPENKNVKILIISGVVDADHSEQAKKAGADDYLGKPFNSKELKEKIKNLLEEKVR